MKTNTFYKRYLIPFLCCYLSGGLFTSCINDLLDTSPYDQIASSTMWTTDYSTDLGIAGVYATLRGGITDQWGRQLYEYDRFGFTGQAREISWKGIDELWVGRATPTNDIFRDGWKDMYTGIYRANDAIANIPAISPSPQEKKDRYVAEAKFLRAYFYFRLNQLYNGVPVYLEPTDAEDYDRPRESPEKVWEVIITDLTDAIKEPNLPDMYDRGSSDYGHITKGAAYALRGKTYLYMGKYEEAISDFTKVAECGYALFQGGYKELFKEQNEQCEEMIFSIQNLALSGYGYDTQRYLGFPSVRGEGWNTYMPSPDLIDLYEWNDGTPFDWEDVIPGYTTMEPQLREVYFLRDIVNLEQKLIANGADDATAASLAESITNQVQSRLTALNEIQPGISNLYLPGGNEERIRKAYENRDPRLEFNIITPYADFLGSVNGVDHTVTMRWPFYNLLAPVNDLRTDTQSWLMYLYRKFVYEETSELESEFMCPTDFPIIRYADVLLMKAEALFELNREPETRTILNQIRSRTSVDMPPVTASGTELRDAIRDERRREFVIEGINYFDELRWGTLKEKAFYPGAGIKQAWGSNVVNISWQGDYSTVWPIPQEEMEKNKNLVQNPVW